MALSDPNTPKTTFITPRRTLASSIRTTNSSTPRRLGPQLTDTPDCFHPVQLETPKQRRTSKEKHPNDEVTNLTVAVRIRPMNKRELATVGAKNIASVHDQDLIIRQQGVVCTDHVFHYDHVLWSCDESSPIHANQEDVFLTIGKPLLNNAFRGYNACLFAYGQTGSGKSFSMMGRTVGDQIDIDSEEYSGITPRFCRELFTRIEKLKNSTATVDVSYFEIYNEKIHDLLADHGNMQRVALKVREHPAWGPYVVDLSVHTVKTYKELRNWLEVGNKNRSTAATNMNEKSSRSHSIFSIELSLSDENSVDDESINSNCRRSKVSLVDLAGSERLGNSHNSEEKIKQGVYINKSLLTLGKVISSLADHKNNHFIPYRDSVLTWLLRESLGGNSLTSMLATITPANSHVEETLSTLRYACHARSIVNRARINENPHDRLIRELRSEVSRLRALRQDYERNSFSISNIHIDEQNSIELDELKTKLNETEIKLKEAERSWEQRFIESKQEQLKAEKLRVELESKVRIMNNIENNVNLSPFRTNFLQELEGVLTDNHINNENINNICDWCKKNCLNCHLDGDSLVIIDEMNKRRCSILLSQLELVKQYENIGDFINSLTWTTNNKIIKKSDILMKMNEIYTALKYLQPNDNENHLSLLYAKVNKSLQSFETALLNNCKNSSHKTVTFNM